MGNTARTQDAIDTRHELAAAKEIRDIYGKEDRGEQCDAAHGTRVYMGHAITRQVRNTLDYICQKWKVDWMVTSTISNDSILIEIVR
jgi:hypothetical protein